MSNLNETCPAELPNWCAQRHWSIFWILILVSVAVVAARVLTLGALTDISEGVEGLPFFSANDRSRWVTVRALVDHGTFEIDEVIQGEDGRRWDTIDKVRHVGRDGQFHYFSSKPPLLSIITAGGYYVLKAVFGWEIRQDTTRVACTILMFINVLPWGIFLWFVARMINSVPVRDWARYFVLGCAGFGTFLSTFTISLNNHVPAAVFTMMALYLVSEMVRKRSQEWKYYAAAGIFAAAAVAHELPALVLLVMLGVVCAWQSIHRTLLCFVPGALLILGLVMLCNWWAWGEFRPAYGHRSDGPLVETVQASLDEALDQGELPKELRDKFPASVKFVDPVVEPGQWPSTPPNQRRWVVRDFEPRSVAQLAIVSERSDLDRSDSEQADSKDAKSARGTGAPALYEYQIRQWGNWYDFPGSYWRVDSTRKSLIDQGQPDQTLYAFHLLFGHHGIFSLTPLWLLSFAGMLALIAGVRMGGRFQMRWLGWLGLVVTLVVFAFYITRPVMDRNYGGVCCTARWLLWLAPIWLMTMLPVVDWLGQSRWGKFVCFGLLFASSVSALVHAHDPWVMPWLYDVWSWTGLPI